uniref:Cytochrome P450 n=1 Tax=Setaria italica TaxID=4555 RepID=K3ZDU0_SETIT
MFSAPRLAARAADRHAEVAALVESLLHGGAAAGAAVTLRPRLFELVLNVMLCAVTGDRARRADVRRFQEIVEETFAVSGAPSVGDFFPALRWVDRLRGVDAALLRLHARRDAFVGGLVNDQRRRRDGEIDPDYYTDTVIKGIVLILLTAGTDTPALTTEWAMALLLTNPEAMQKVRAELDANVGTARLVEESDMTNLPYLQCVVKETLRLCPVAPVIPAHEAMEDCTVGGFAVRRGTMILVNAWAIHRDPKLWDAPEEFRPERFLHADTVGAVTVQMLPFGLGRRRCPGEGLAMRLVSLTLAALVQCFEWGVGEGRSGVDMDEGVGLTMPMATPLSAVRRTRKFVRSMLSASTR